MKDDKYISESPRELFSVEEGEHRGKYVLWIKFDKEYEKIQLLKSFTKATFSWSRKCWYVTDNATYRELFGLPQKIVGKQAWLRIHEVNIPAFRRYQEQIILMGYSPNTMRTYTTEFAQLLYLLKDKPVETLTPEKLRSYILYCHEKLHLSENQIQSRINALKFYFEKVIGREKMFVEIPRPKTPLLLPKALNQREVKKLLSATDNAKHRLIIEFAYGLGLRVSEIVNLKLEDVDTVKLTVFISKAKGKKDRYVNLPYSIAPQLKAYYKEYQPKEFLFEGQYGGRYSARSAQAVFKNAMKKAKIRKNVGIHSLRHSYATHLLEYGTDIRLIQELMGHNNLKTTEIYTHITDIQKHSIKSPLDYL